MIDFEIKNSLVLPENQLKIGLYIWVLHANKIPPHIGLSINGNFFSLKVSSKDVAVSYEKVFDLISKKNIQTIFIEIKDFNPEMEDKIVQIFNEFDCINSYYTSCLIPIVKALIIEKNPQIERLSQLLENLKEKNQIKSFFQLNLETDFEGIPKYTKQDIQKRIEELKDVKRRKYLPQSN
jgi:hypothetical protein